MATVRRSKKLVDSSSDEPDKTKRNTPRVPSKHSSDEVGPKVVNVKVRYIRPGYNNLSEWMDDPDNIYIGRGGIVFIQNSETGQRERFPKEASKWHNPYKIGKNCEREECLEKYEEYIRGKIRKDPKKYDLRELSGKNLGCWCKPDRCHGDVLVKLFHE